MAQSGRLSRRSVLRFSAGLAVPIFAGCTGQWGGEESTPSDSEIRDVRYEGGDMVVELRENHEVERLSLIAPDGSTFAQTEVAVGAISVSFQVLSIEPGRSDFTHYQPGRYELTASTETESKSLNLQLQPDFRIVDVHQLEGDQRANAKLAVVVENVGSAPSWVYDVTYQGAPNSTANDAVADGPGVPLLSSPGNPSELIVSPGKRQTFIGTTEPFLFTDNGDQQCSGRYRLTIIVGVADGNSLTQRVQATVDGDSKSAGLTGEYTCTGITLEMVTSGDSNG